MPRGGSRAAFAAKAFTKARKYGPKGLKFIDEAEKIKKMYDAGDIPGLLRKFEVPEYIQRKNIKLFPTAFFDNDQQKDT